MRLRYSSEDEACRAHVRAWFETHWPAFRARWPEPGAERTVALRRAWEDHLCAEGWSGLAWPLAYGGKAWPLTRQAIFHEEYARSGAPLGMNIIGHGILAPTLLHFGSDAQKERFLPGILSNRELWCQGYSEPGAGSDLAALSTRAVREGDHYVLNGHKIWTSFAHLADWCFVLARTDPEAPRHRGISFLLVDMKSPGIRTAPIRQMTGEAEFNEVFFENVRVPVAQRVGEENAGWRIAMSAASFERGTYFIPRQVRFARELEAVVALARTHHLDGRPAIETPSVRRRLARLRADARVLRLLTLRALTAAMRGGPPGPEGSSTKLCWSEAHQRLHALAAELLGPQALLGPEGPEGIGPVVREALWTRAETLLAGTSEIQRNIIAEHVLGLPRG